MKRPTQVKIGPFIFSIIYQEIVLDPSDPARTMEGHCSQSKMEIHIATKDSGDEFIRTTLWHEIKHGIIGLTIDESHTEPTTEEAVITKLVALEIGVLRDNPELVKYLLG